MGVAYGMSQMFQFIVWGVLFYVSTDFQFRYGVVGEDSFLALFALIMAALGAGQA